MSDNVCPKCGAERNTAGLIVHVANCPNITTTNWTSTIHYIFPNTITIDEREYHFLQSEIARLKAALEQAVRDRDAAYELCKTQSDNLDKRDMDIFDLNRFYFDLSKERDKARKWARKLYRMGIKYQKISRELSVLCIKSTAGILNEPNLLKDE